MPFQLSPGVNVTEIDLTTVVPSVASSDAAIAGIFNWGPVNQRILIDSETKLVSMFGKPNANNYETFFTAANFLSYSNRLYVVRTANTSNNTVAIGGSGPYATSNTGAMSAIANVGSATAFPSYTVDNDDDYVNVNFNTVVMYVARYPGALGNSLKVSVCDSANAYTSTLYMNAAIATEATDVSTVFTIAVGATSASITCSNGATGTAVDANTYANNLLANVNIGDIFTVGNASLGYQDLRVSGVTSLNVSTHSFLMTFDTSYRLSTDFTANGTVNNTVARKWEYYNVVNTPPKQSTYMQQYGNTAANDSMHVVVIDENGAFSGIVGQVLETYPNVSRATDSLGVGGSSNYYKTIINKNSNYIWAGADRSTSVSNTAINLTSAANTKPMTLSFQGGTDGWTESTVPVSILANGYDLYNSAENVDVSLVLQGKPTGGTLTSTSTGGYTANNFQLANYLIDNIAEIRKDCVVFISPDDAIVTGHKGAEALSLVGWRGALHDSSYAVIDSGYKYMYDRYNDLYRYVPTNGDIAGLCARTDNTRDPWWSPAGFNRGQIKNMIKMRYNPTKADRDIIYKNNINPIVSFPGKGTILYGDKTLQSQPSAFDHINVRRLFIVLEKAISTAAKTFLFEFNDDFTRAQFKNLVTPYLRDVQSRRGITDFLVICDATNNTAERIDRNEFWGDIYIKPARSINYIQLNFVAVRTGVQFSEIVGKF
jgi:phage tail sheath protein FI